MEYITREEFLRFRKEMQERLAKIDERSKFWRERLVYWSIIAGLIVVLVMLAIR